MSLSVCTAFFPFALSSSSSPSSPIATRLCVALPPFLVSVPVFVTVVVVFAGFFVRFDMADLFARWRGAGLRLRAFIFI